jgi:hypothetical protein
MLPHLMPECFGLRALNYRMETCFIFDSTNLTPAILFQHSLFLLEIDKKVSSPLLYHLSYMVGMVEEGPLAWY